MRAKRVLLVVENVSLARDHRLRKQVGALHGAGYRVTVICRRDPANAVPDGVRLLEYRAPVEGSSALGFVREYLHSWLAAAWLVVRAALTGGFDAIQVSGTPDIYFALAAPFRLFGKRVVLDQRDLSPELFELRFGRRGAVYRVVLLLERLSYRSVDHVVTVNGSLREVARQRGGLPAASVTVVGNGPPLARTAPRPGRPELRHGRRHLCCWLGLMGPQDQVSLALRSVAHLVHELGRTDCQFAFIGDGECRPALEREVRELGIVDYVTFPGWLDEPAAFTYLRSADLGIEPNLEHIVSPVKGMEFMAFGLPFVAFDLRETRALAGDAALYAQPGDVEGFADLIAQLLDDPERRRALGAAGRDRVVREIAWEHQERAYLGVYRRLLGDEVPAASAPDRAALATGARR